MSVGGIRYVLLTIEAVHVKPSVVMVNFWCLDNQRACAGGLQYVLCVCVCVCVSVTTLVAVCFISIIKLRYEQLQFSILFIFNL